MITLLEEVISMKSEGEMTGRELLEEDRKIRVEFERQRLALEQVKLAYKEAKTQLVRFDAQYKRIVDLLKEVG
jgi:hypothetical protein